MKTRKFLSVLLTLAMVVSLLPGIAVPASALGPIDYTITSATVSGVTTYTVSGNANSFTTLALALAACATEGDKGDGVLTIQFGDGNTPLIINEAEPSSDENNLIAATYTGEVEIANPKALTSGFGLAIASGEVTFDELKVTNATEATFMTAVKVTSSGTLNITENSSITVNGEGDSCVANDGKLTFSSGTISASGANSVGAYNAHEMLVSGGTITATSGIGLKQVGEGLSQGLIVTSGSISGYTCGVYSSTGSVFLSGGTVECTGTTLSDTAGAAINLESTATATISDNSTAAVVSATTETIRLRTGSGHCASVLNKIINSNTNAKIVLMGVASSGKYTIDSSNNKNYTKAAVIASSFNTGCSFAGWAKNSPDSESISATNGTTIEDLELSETDYHVYLKTGTVAEVKLTSGSPGTLGDGTITGLIVGAKYKVTMGPLVYYSKADGTLSLNSSDSAALTGTAITGLINGSTYKVEDLATYSISGKVSAGTTGAGVGSLTVSLYSSTDSTSAVGTDTTDNEGNFEITDVSGGTYYAVVAEGIGYSKSSSSLITVSGAPVTGVGITLTAEAGSGLTADFIISNNSDNSTYDLYNSVTSVTNSKVTFANAISGCSDSNADGTIVIRFGNTGTALNLPEAVVNAENLLNKTATYTGSAIITDVTGINSGEGLTIGGSVIAIFCDLSLSSDISDTSEMHLIHVNAGNTLNITGATTLKTTGQRSSNIKNNGTVNISGISSILTCSGAYSYAVMNSKIFNMSAGTITTTGTSCTGLQNADAATAAITGGKINDTSEHSGVYNVGTLTISQSNPAIPTNISSTNVAVTNMGGTVTITGGTLEASGAICNVLYVCGSTATASLQSCVLKAKNMSIGGNVITVNSGAAVTINDNTIIDCDGTSINAPAIYIDAGGAVSISGTNTSITAAGVAITDGGAQTTGNGSLYIKEASISAPTAILKLGTGTATIESGTITSSSVAISQRDGTLNITGGIITGEVNGVESIKCGTLNITGGTVASTGASGAAVKIAPNTSNGKNITALINDAAILSSISNKTILLARLDSTYTHTGSLSLFGKTIHNSTQGAITITGKTDTTNIINSLNYKDATIAASDIDYNRKFTAWTSDPDLTAIISTTDGDSISNLTTGSNNLVGNIYLKDQAKTVTLATGSLGTAGNGAITGLIAGTVYKITYDANSYYVKADGTLSASPSAAEALMGTEITGLTNGTTYKVEAVSIVLDSGSLGTSGNGAVTGLVSGAKYTVTVGSTVNYVKADGTLSTNASDSAALTGTTITGLTNGTTYKVEAVSIVLDSGSLGTVGNGAVSGLVSGAKYTVTVGSTVNYVKADGTLSASASDSAALTGTTITGLTNGTTYKVEAVSVFLDSGSLGTAENGTVTGLVSGAKYTVTVGSTVNYVKADGTLSASASDSVALTGTTITGLTNGTTYKVEAVSVFLDSGSLGTAENGNVTGLVSGAKYTITVGSTVNYVKADGTLSASASDTAALTGTTITGLTNGTTYKVVAVSIVLDSGSLGTSGNGTVSGLVSGAKYTVTVGPMVYYVKADGTLSTNASDSAALTGTTIIALTNGTTYKVEVVSIVLDSGSLGTADNGAVSGLVSGAKYTVTVGSTVYYVKADGTLSTNASDSAALTGTTITGLANGTTYKVEAVSIVLDSGSLGTSGNGTVSGLVSGAKYTVTVGSTVNYVKADGTLSANASDSAALTGTTITGLTNGTTYKVEAVSIVLDSGSIGTAGNGAVSGLVSGAKYTVTVGSTVNYVKADGTLSASASDTAALTGTTITGLTNGTTYKVEAVSVFLDSGSIGTAGNGAVTGLVSGAKYTVTVGSTVNYVKADGTLSASASDTAALTGTTITGLANGTTYKVEAVSIVLDSGSLGTSGNGTVSGLVSGAKYTVTVGSTVNYVKADGTLSANASDSAALTGTTITGLTNGTTYKVEAVSIVLDSGSIGTAGNGAVSGLVSGAKYTVTVGSTVNYVKADGTLSASASDTAALTGTTITGLTNGTTYKVEAVSIVLDSGSIGTAGNGTVSGLVSGAKYTVTVGSTVNYVKADGTLSTNASDSAALTGTTITGLTNGTTYKVEAVSVFLNSGSLGTSGNGTVSGLVSGTKYKVTVGSTVYYVNADGTLSANASDSAALTGTTITGLTNGTTYLVEEYKVILASGSLGTAGNGEIYGLTSGSAYIVTSGTTIYYVKADGTLSTSSSNSATLTGTKITGLTNGTTYLVEEYKVILASGSLGTAGNGKITGLIPGTKYQVIVSGVTVFVTAGGTISLNYSDLGELSGTEITGLENGMTYLIKVYSPSVLLYSPSLGTAGNGCITNLPNDQLVVVIYNAYADLQSQDMAVYYVTQNGSLSANPANIGTFAGGTISGLTNNMVYIVINYQSVGANIMKTMYLSTDSLGTIEDPFTKISGLTSGTKYKITMDSTVYYSKADGTVTTDSSQAAALTGTEITGLALGCTYKVEVYTSGGGSGGSGGSGGNTPATDTGAKIEVGGKTQTAGTVETTTKNGKTTTTVTIPTDKLKGILDSAGSGATITLPITTGSATASGRLDGQAVKDMEKKDATLVIDTGSASYSLPASDINIDAVSGKFGNSVSLSDIAVNVSISTPSDATAKVVANAAVSGGFSIQVPAVEFAVTCTYNGQTVEVSTFNSYVERLIAIPAGVDPSKITTGIVVEPDGSTHHVPTEVIVINGKYYAKINSLTNSVYSVIWNPIEFSDVENYWAKDAINDMGSRMVVSGVGNNNYDPDRNMTRAEFAAIMVKALGLEPGTGTNSFDDVASTDWYSGYIKTAASYGIINGYDNGTFGPNDTITREQGMTMIARAMKITGLTVTLTDSDVSTLIGAYTDGASASDYAKDSMVACLKTGITSGTSATTISPKADITRAEVAVMVQRLLQKSGLI